ncbi:hypothetical protein EVAR_36961_1 [Eumeta japonica]|uniref:Uncharacterized protein n=1 Tax=Eumeta variegata TaxID=151549 RepID=A0A4C1W6Y9_EUMVA|nr:hypothetical protein EVAR_36961_1 [Eumeta japonica]
MHQADMADYCGFACGQLLNIGSMSASLPIIVTTLNSSVVGGEHKMIVIIAVRGHLQPHRSHQCVAELLDRNSNAGWSEVLIKGGVDGGEASHRNSHSLDKMQ